MKKTRKLLKSRSFAQRLRAGEQLIGTIIGSPAPAVVEVLAGSGLDWLFIDGEHGTLDSADLIAILQGAGNCPCVVRTPSHDPVWIARALDAGAAGIIVPRVDDAQQAATIVAHAKYPPAGRRGLGLARAHGYGLRFKEYLANANRETVIIVQAESQLAVDNIAAIAKVPGVDAIFIGPYDLSASLGCTGDIGAAIVSAAVDKIMKACRRAGKQVGYFSGNVAGVRRAMKQGATLPVVGTESLLLLGAARNMLAELGR